MDRDKERGKSFGPTLSTFGIRAADVAEDFSRIIDTYREDYNILDLHAKIQRKLAWERVTLCPDLDRKITRETYLMAQGQTVVEAETSKHRLAEWKKMRDEIGSGQKLQTYLNLTRPYIQEYKKIGPLVKTIDFGEPSQDNHSNHKHQTINLSNQSNQGLQSTEKDENKEDEYRLKIIEEYLKIASNYYDLDIIREIDSVARCVCGAEYEESEADLSGLQTCVCGCLKEIMIKTPFYKDGSRVNNPSSNNYEDEANFYKAFLRFQGKQPIKLPEDLFTNLDDYFRRLKLPIGEEIRKMKLKRNGRRGPTDKEMMYTALADRGYANHYEDINLICHVYWGWELPDISDLENAIMEDYRQSQKVYESLPKDRHSSLNSQYRLYRHLQRLGYPCKEIDFKMIKTPNIVDDYEEFWEKICTALGWAYVEIR